jgi:hypothetical protein
MPPCFREAIVAEKTGNARRKAPKLFDHAEDEERCSQGMPRPGQRMPCTWQRMKKQREGLDITASMKYSAMRHVEAAPAQFEPLKLNAFRTGSHAVKTL